MFDEKNEGKAIKLFLHSRGSETKNFDHAMGHTKCIIARRNT